MVIKDSLPIKQNTSENDNNKIIEDHLFNNEEYIDKNIKINKNNVSKINS